MPGRAAWISVERCILPSYTREQGGPGAGACSGDLLLGALAACAQLTAQAVAENFGIDLDISVEASGDLDLRGTMGVDKKVPVGFEDISLNVSVDGDVGEDTQKTLQTVTERYCVVFQTLIDPPAVEISWTFS